MEDSVCPLCEYADRVKLEDSIGKGIVTKTAIANQLAMSVEEVWEHMKNHLHEGGVKKYTREIKAGLDEQYNKYDMLFNNLLKLDDVFGPLIERAATDPTNARLPHLIKLASEIRSTVSDLAKLKGEMASESRITIIHYNQLKAVVMSSMCKKCKPKVMNALEDDEFEKKMKELVKV